MIKFTDADPAKAKPGAKAEPKPPIAEAAPSEASALPEEPPAPEPAPRKRRKGAPA